MGCCEPQPHPKAKAAHEMACESREKIKAMEERLERLERLVTEFLDKIMAEPSE